MFQLLKNLFAFFLVMVSLCLPASSQTPSEGFGSFSLLNPDSSKAEPRKVGVGIFIDQISFIDQQAENFGVVGTLFLKLDLPALSFDPPEGAAAFRSYSREQFMALAAENGQQLPYFILRNQQGRRFVQQVSILLRPDGRVTYAERFSATLQAPHFNFVRFPFDNQKFFVEVSSMLPRQFVEFYPLKKESGLGDLLGEEEWIVHSPHMLTSTVPSIGDSEASMVALRFEANRHILFYILRILLPLLIILFVSWATFFLEEYRRRVDMAAGNLLVFVAFNFAISTSLPKLGYLTFMDSLLVGMFIITGSMVLVNIALRRIKVNENEALARKIDRYLVVWVYPLMYVGFLFWAIRFYLI